MKKYGNLNELQELKLKYAYNQGNPIVNPTQMLKDKELAVSCVDDIVEDLVKEHKYNAILDGANPEFIKVLEEKLCSFAGELLCFDNDEYAELVLEEGQLWYGDPIYFEQMAMGECHSNSIEVNDENPECPIVVGYALDSYGFWFTHTWLLVQEDDEKNSFVFETTSPSELYFGVVLTQSQLKEFKDKYRE